MIREGVGPQNHSGAAAPLGSKILWYRSVESTNAVARSLSEEGTLAHGTLILADHQTAGRGRRGRKWEAPPGSSLLLTLVLRPADNSLLSEHSGHLMLLTGLAVARSVRTATQLPACVKWPNDVLVHGRKVAGVLVELMSASPESRIGLVGIGINCNQEPEDFSPTLRHPATSLAEELGTELDRPALLACLVEEFSRLYQQFEAGHFEAIAAEWRQLSATIGQLVHVELPDQVLTGRAEDITGDGLLVLRLPDGSLQQVSAGDVVIASPQTGTTGFNRGDPE